MKEGGKKEYEKDSRISGTFAFSTGAKSGNILKMEIFFNEYVNTIEFLFLGKADGGCMGWSEGGQRGTKLVL